jgi:hypothetical protein
MLLALIILLLRGTAEAREIESLVRFFEKNYIYELEQGFLPFLQQTNKRFSSVACT